MKVKDPNDAGYPSQFNQNGSHDLQKVARFESYRGFLFGSLNPEVKPLRVDDGVVLEAAAKMNPELQALAVEVTRDRKSIVRAQQEYMPEFGINVTADLAGTGSRARARPRHWSTPRR